MFNQLDGKWIKRILVSIVSGGLIGKCISLILGIILTDEKWALFLQIWVPLCVVASLLIVLYRYQKEKEDIIE